MIITKTPYRISLFGGGTDYPAWFKNKPSRVVSAAIANYCYFTVKVLPPFFEHKNQESGSTFWHLHPELVDNDEETGNCTTMLCHNCTTAVKKNKIPDLSIACGLDFGYHRWIKGLVEPNLQEQLILAKTRMYFAVMKATSNSHGASKDFDARCMARVHAILFPHNAPEVATYLYNPKLYEENGLLDLAQLKHQMHIFFVTYKGESDRLASPLP